MTLDIADHDSQITGGKDKRVVPIAADPSFLGGDVASRELHARALRQAGGEQAALEHSRCCAFDAHRSCLNGAGDSIGDQPKQAGVVLIEDSLDECSNM
jgi:hypothetical protein